MDPAFQRLIATAKLAENEGRHADAEAAYLQAVRAAGDDALIVGSLYVDLGRNADAGRRDEDAVRFFQTAISTLEGLRGDGMIECAYAHYDLARLMARLERPEAVDHARRARELLDRHPFTSPTDLADARILYVAVVAETNGSLTEGDMRGAWAALLAAPPESLDRSLLESFVPNYLSMTMRAFPAEFDERLEELSAWAPPELLIVLLARVRQLLDPE